MLPGQKLVVPRGDWKVTGVKYCPRCKENKVLAEFYYTGGKPAGHCNTCRLAYLRQRRKENPARIREIERKSKLKAAYGITPEQYEQMLVAQGNSCAICKSTLPFSRAYKNSGKTRRFVVDHCHVTGRVRGLLCNRCNRALGLIADNSTVLSQMLEYLRKHQD